jgi:hypothetical protein
MARPQQPTSAVSQTPADTWQHSMKPPQPQLATCQPPLLDHITHVGPTQAQSHLTDGPHHSATWQIVSGPHQPVLATWHNHRKPSQHAYTTWHYTIGPPQ